VKSMLILIASHAALLSMSTAAHAQITGAGSTFAAPIYTAWAEAYVKSGGGKVSYRSVGSTEGLRKVLGGEVDFAGSDAPLSDDGLSKRGLVQFPTVIGGVVPVVNVPGVKPGELMLSGQVLSAIYLGKIANWNDPAIAALNTKVTLPDLAIAVVRRSDGSGTTLIWTHYLSQVSTEWKAKVGEGTTVRWPRGMGGKGNEGVATFIRYVPGSIGYVAWDFTKQNHIAYTAMRNASGARVEPGPESLSAAAMSTNWVSSRYEILTNEPGANAWPVMGATFVLMQATPGKSDHIDQALAFFDWALTNGNRAAQALDYIPLPEAVASGIRLELQAKRKSQLTGQ